MCVGGRRGEGRVVRAGRCGAGVGVRQVRADVGASGGFADDALWRVDRPRRLALRLLRHAPSRGTLFLSRALCESAFLRRRDARRRGLFFGEMRVLFKTSRVATGASNFARRERCYQCSADRMATRAVAEDDLRGHDVDGRYDCARAARRHERIFGFYARCSRVGGDSTWLSRVCTI